MNAMLARLILNKAHNPIRVLEDEDLKIRISQKLGRERMVISGEWHPRIARIIQERSVPEVVISRGSTVKSLRPFVALKCIQHLYVGCLQVDDLGCISQMTLLSELTLYAENNQELLDFGPMERLRRCKIYLKKKRESILHLKSLRRLDISGSSAAELDCSELGKLRWFRVESCAKLKAVRFSPKAAILGIWMDRAPKLNSFQPLSAMKAPKLLFRERSYTKTVFVPSVERDSEGAATISWYWRTG